MQRTSPSPIILIAFLASTTLGVGAAGLEAGQGSFDAAMEAGTRAMAAERPADALEAFEEAVALRPEHPVARAFLGAALLELGRLGEAIRELEWAVDVAPSLFVAQYHLGLALLEAGDPRRARGPLSVAVDQRPDDAGARLALAQALVDGGDAAAALPHLSHLVGREPGMVRAWQQLGQAMLRLDRHQEALQALERAEERSPSDPETLYGKGLALARLDRYSEAAESLERAVAEDPDRADAWLLLGQVLQVLTWQGTDLQTGVRAAEALERALELRPHSRKALISLAEVYRRLGLYEEVLTILDELERSSTEPIPAAPGIGSPRTDEADLALMRGRVLSLLGRYREARSALEQAVDRGAGALAWYGLGEVHRSLSDVDAALEAFAQAVAVEPGFGAAWREQGDLLIDRQRYAEARQALQAAVEVAPGDARAWYLLGVAHLRAGDAAAALGPLERAMELDPELTRAAYNLATALRLTGRTEESAAMLERFQQLSAETGGTVSGVERSRAEIAALNRQGLYYYRRGQPERAIERFQRALELRPRNEVVHFNLGLVHAALADWEAAAAALEEARNRKPDRAEIWSALAEVYRALGRTDDAERAQSRYEELRRR